ncbi:MAG: twin-arginine translocase TatA/TatE family subunit [Bacteroidaceae bacterium]|nr:twin-arginine translocase TatA/TatE family subunit [Bacteroidaceae bacterium]
MIQVIPLMIGATELLLIAGIALLLFGGKKLPEMMRGLGRGVKEFKEGMNEGTKPENNEANSEKEIVADDQNSIDKENNDK